MIRNVKKIMKKREKSLKKRATCSSEVKTRLFQICMFFSLYIMGGIIGKVHRKKEYLKQTTVKYIFYFLTAWNYFYNYHLRCFL